MLTFILSLVAVCLLGKQSCYDDELRVVINETRAPAYVSQETEAHVRGMWERRATKQNERMILRATRYCMSADERVCGR